MPQQINETGRTVFLSQVQIIRSLAEALAWFEKELGWGVNPSELRHLTGRIGELYTAMITRGQMALAVNQRGYDVISAEGQRISVKTVTISNHLTFRKSTIQEVDRVVVLRINIDGEEASIEEVVDAPASAFLATCQESADGYRYGIRGKSTAPVDFENLMVSARAEIDRRSIVQYENGTIVVEEDGRRVPVAKLILRDVAKKIGVSLLNGSGNKKNTRQLGCDIIATLNA